MTLPSFKYSRTKVAVSIAASLGMWASFANAADTAQKKMMTRWLLPPAAAFSKRVHGGLRQRLLPSAAQRQRKPIRHWLKRLNQYLWLLVNSWILSSQRQLKKR